MRSLKFLSVILTLFISFLPLAQSQTQKLTPVPNVEVCMVNDIHFNRPQIPVNFAGKTYYGCCEMCKTTLATQASSRMAIDPISKKGIDKASAVIGAKADGSVVYFENKKNFDKYSSAP